MIRNQNKSKMSQSRVNPQVYQEIVSRALLAAKMGTQFGGERDLYRALGYPVDDISFADYLSRYLRQDIARAVIDRPVNSTWQGSLELLEASEENDTSLEIAWKELEKRLHLKSRFSRCDKLTGLGEYGVLLLGLDDVKSTEDFVKPVSKGIRKLNYVKPFSSETARISSLVKNTKDPRYGLPEIYEIKIGDVTSNTTSFVKVHHTRIIHVVDGSLEDEVYGIPRLEGIFNRLMDLDKVIGGDAEMFWRGARPGYHGKVDKDYQMTADVEKDLINQIDEFEHNLRRILINEGVDLVSLAQQNFMTCSGGSFLN